MNIELLYPEICCLYGDKGNSRYLIKCLEENGVKVNVIETHLDEKPRFLEEDIQLVYIGSLADTYITTLLDRLMPHQETILKKIDSGQVILATGNALELFIKKIEWEDGKIMDGLGVFDAKSIHQIPNRFNSLFFGELLENGKEIAGYSSRFSHVYPNAGEERFLAKAKRGTGNHEGCEWEGFKYKNLLATNLLGPILVLSPNFTISVLTKIGISQPKLAFESDVREAFEVRKREYLDPKVNLS